MQRPPLGLASRLQILLSLVGPVKLTQLLSGPGLKLGWMNLQGSRTLSRGHRPLPQESCQASHSSVTQVVTKFLKEEKHFFNLVGSIKCAFEKELLTKSLRPLDDFKGLCFDVFRA